MSLLTVVQNACDEVGMPRPATVASAADNTTRQLFALANREGKDLSTGGSVGRSYDWTALQTECVFTTVGTESQGLITTLAPGFRYIIGDTIWNRSQRLPFPGALTPQDWQLLKAAFVSGPYPQYRIRDGELIMLPVPTAGQTAAFEYVTSFWATDSTGATLNTGYVLDGDVALLDEDLITLGVVWRFKKAKGLDFADDYENYKSRVFAAMGRDGGKTKLDMGDRGYVPRIVIPEGNWPV